MSSNPSAPRPTINGNNGNVDAMLAKLNQRLSDLAATLGVPQKNVQVANDPEATPPVSTVLSSTQNHINWLQTAHNFMDDIEATLGPQKS